MPLVPPPMQSVADARHSYNILLLKKRKAYTPPGIQTNTPVNTSVITGTTRTNPPSSLFLRARFFRFYTRFRVSRDSLVMGLWRSFF